MKKGRKLAMLQRMRKKIVFIQLPIQGRGGEEGKRAGNDELQRMRNE